MDALLLIDIQKDFLPGGSLEVKEGDQVIPVANELQQHFELVVATQDYHPRDHGSFAASHEGKKPGDHIELNGLDQVLWPVHCVQGSEGAEFADDLQMGKVEKIFRKGVDSEIDSYSGFYDNGHKRSTGLSDYLKDKGVDRVYIVGLAADVCVKFTALDALKEGFDTVVVKDGTRAVNLREDDYENTMQELKDKGAEIMESREVIRARAGS
ncbi:MAG: bifunctional nicotinamidase/pyrazinamidase [Cyclobacteriaceae bacterium]